MATYLFYDLETTGLNRCFDQILQFACIRTDLQFNEIESFSSLVKLRQDVLYAPKALITTNISINDSTREGMVEYEVIKKIHELFNQSDTISIGYNSLEFDDKFLRFSFHRNLLPIYTHQFQNGCYRMDMLPIATMYFLFRKQILCWPGNLRLEDINNSNQLIIGQAHDALVDVKVTIELAKRFATDSKMWNYVISYFNKTEDNRRIQNLPVYIRHKGRDYRWGLMIGVKFGSERRYQCPVLNIGNSLHYTKQTLWLRLDLPNLKDTTNETISQNTWIIRKKLGEPNFLIPPKETMPKEIYEIFQENKRWIEGNTVIFQQIINYHRNYQYAFIPNLDVEAALYQNGFLDEHDQLLTKQFHKVSFADKIKIVDQFHSTNIKVIAKRFFCRNYSSGIPANFFEEFNNYKRRLFNGIIDFKRKPHHTAQMVIEKINEIIRNEPLNHIQKQLLEELETYVHTQLVAIN